MKAPGTRAKKEGHKAKARTSGAGRLLPSAQNQSGARTAAAEELSVLAPAESACCSANNRRENTHA